jgi:hypothetical protein
MIKPTIKTVTPSSADQAVSTVALAFSADPAARWLYPDPHQYIVNFPSFVRAFGGKAFEQGSAYSIDGCSGAALWLPPDVHPDEEILVGLIQRTVPMKGKKRSLECSGRWAATIRVNLIGIYRSSAWTRPCTAKDTARR